MRFGISFAAEAAGLLGAEPDDADGTLRSPGVHDVLGGCSDDRNARGVIDRAGAEIPAVEVAADQQDRRTGVAPRHFGDHVARLSALRFLADQREMHLHG